MSKRKVKKNGNIKISTFEDTSCYGYDGFLLYFSNEDHVNAEKIIKNTTSFESYIHRNLKLFSTKKIKETLAFNVNLKSLLVDKEFNAEWEGFQNEIVDNTETCLNCMGLAVHQILVKEENTNELSTVRCRLLNNEPILQLKHLQTSYYGKLISLRGTVMKVGTVCVAPHDITFKCLTCTGSQVVNQVDNNFTTPTKCLSKGCKAKSGKNFIPLPSSCHTRTVNSQLIKLRELVGEENDNDYEQTLQTIECDLTEDLVNCCIPGDDIMITGIVKVRNSGQVPFRHRQPNIHLLYLDVVSVFNESNICGNRKSSIQFNKHDYDAIRKIHSEPNLFRFLIHSLCPNVYGHEIVKAGLLLSIFGGTSNDNNIRPDSHMLIVGDPGLGKSKMLKACVNVSPRGVYVCGNASTQAGLTVTMSKQGNTGDWAFEAGALILADQGTCCIDEFDKMTNLHTCLLEAMEQQSISIAKAGFNCNVPARMSILAAANPINGNYNNSKTVAENLKINSALLSRFDLLFILVDKPDKAVDDLLSEHILALTSGKRFNTKLSTSTSKVNDLQNNNDLKLRLRLRQGEEIDLLPQNLFRLYITYAKKYVHPKLNTNAYKVLKEFYMGLRKNYQTGNTTPVTIRQFESMIRLTQARAKCELRHEATDEDAKDVIQIMRASLIEVFNDDVMNFTRSQTGISKKAASTNMVKLLKRKADELDRSTFSMAELKDYAEQIGLQKSNFNSVFDSLNLEGYILKKGSNTFQLSV